jgi:Flp pilus assembly pilin Flp
VRSIRKFVDFLLEERGQSLTEYTLLIAFVSMLALSVFIAAGGYTQDIWSMGNSRLAAASQTVNATTATSSTPAGGGADQGHK